MGKRYGSLARRRTTDTRAAAGVRRRVTAWCQTRDGELAQAIIARRSIASFLALSLSFFFFSRGVTPGRRSKQSSTKWLPGAAVAAITEKGFDSRTKGKGGGADEHERTKKKKPKPFSSTGSAKAASASSSGQNHACFILFRNLPPSSLDSADVSQEATHSADATVINCGGCAFFEWNHVKKP